MRKMSHHKIIWKKFSLEQNLNIYFLTVNIICFCCFQCIAICFILYFTQWSRITETTWFLPEHLISCASQQYIWLNIYWRLNSLQGIIAGNIKWFLSFFLFVLFLLKQFLPWNKGYGTYCCSMYIICLVYQPRVSFKSERHV